MLILNILISMQFFLEQTEPCGNSHCTFGARQGIIIRLPRGASPN
jgi:hypothetical protein